MTITFEPDETFRGDFTFRNSPEAVRRFPFPFPDDAYMYSVNVEPHVPGPKGSCYEFPIDVDEHYVAECRERAVCLAARADRYLALPHTMPAQWDVLELVTTSLARDYPEHFTLDRAGARWRWHNRPLGVGDEFTFGDPATLPCEPLEYVTRQAQGDWCVLDQRDGMLWMDAGMVTTQADWSLNFDLGMNFTEWHGPVPLAHELGAGPCGRDRGQRGRPGPPAGRGAGAVAAAAEQRGVVRDPLLPDQPAGSRDRAEVGPEGAPGAA